MTEKTILDSQKNLMLKLLALFPPVAIWRIIRIAMQHGRRERIHTVIGDHWQMNEEWTKTVEKIGGEYVFTHSKPMEAE